MLEALLEENPPVEPFLGMVEFEPPMAALEVVKTFQRQTAFGPTRIHFAIWRFPRLPESYDQPKVFTLASYGSLHPG